MFLGLLWDPTDSGNREGKLGSGRWVSILTLLEEVSEPFDELGISWFQLPGVFEALGFQDLAAVTKRCLDHLP